MEFVEKIILLNAYAAESNVMFGGKATQRGILLMQELSELPLTQAKKAFYRLSASVAPIHHFDPQDWSEYSLLDEKYWNSRI